VSPLTADEVFAELPKSVSTPEIKVPMDEGKHYAFISKFREVATFPGARVTTIDGVRADYPHGWGLVRCSNTTPVLVLRFEADDNPALHRIQEEFKRQLLALDGTLARPL
jgi:phosphomannomutase/phosphoglucomutase